MVFKGHFQIKRFCDSMTVSEETFLWSGTLSIHVSTYLYLHSIPLFKSLFKNAFSHLSALGRRCWVWLFQALLSASDELHFTRSLQNSILHSFCRTSAGCAFILLFQEVNHIYIAEEVSSLRSRMALHYLICVQYIFERDYISAGRYFKWVQMLTRGDKKHTDKKQQQNTNLGIESWVTYGDTVTHCSHVSLIPAK